MSRLKRRITVYRFRVIHPDGEIRQSRMYAFLPPAKKQAAYWIGRGFEVTIERSTGTVAFTKMYGWRP